MWWSKSHNIITKKELMVLIHKTFDYHVHNPLNKKYKLIPDEQWLRSHTPNLARWVEDWYDCDAIACDMMARNHSFCVGMATVEWGDKLNHTLNMAVLDNKTFVLYDPLTKKIHKPSEYKLVGMWL